MAISYAAYVSRWVPVQRLRRCRGLILESGNSTPDEISWVEELRKKSDRTRWQICRPTFIVANFIPFLGARDPVWKAVTALVYRRYHPNKHHIITNFQNYRVLDSRGSKYRRRYAPRDGHNLPTSGSGACFWTKGLSWTNGVISMIKKSTSVLHWLYCAFYSKNMMSHLFLKALTKAKFSLFEVVPVINHKILLCFHTCEECNIKASPALSRSRNHDH